MLALLPGYDALCIQSAFISPALSVYLLVRITLGLITLDGARVRV